MRLIRLLKKDLAKEISTWADEKLITAEQARSLCRRYDIDYDAIHSGAGGYRLLIALGYLFIGLALITLLSANWEQIPRALRMAGLLLITMGTQGFALWLYAGKRESAATGLFLLGNFFYGASIILIAQIYHLGEHMPDGVFWWALGSLPFGVLLKNSWLTLFSCLLALIWFFLEVQLGFYPALFPLFLAAAVYVLAAGRPSTLLLLTAVAGFVFWLEATVSLFWAGQKHQLILHAEHVPITAALFVLLYAFGHWLNSRADSRSQDYGVVLGLWTLRFGLIAMLVLSFAEPWEELIRAGWLHPGSLWQILLVLFGGALWLGWKAGRLQTLVPIVVFCAASAVAVVYSNDRDHAIYFQVAYNIALVCSGIWLIVRGIGSGISHYFFLGIASILLVAFMRYIDLIGEYVGGAVLFIVLAVLLLGAAKYWKSQQSGAGQP